MTVKAGSIWLAVAFAVTKRTPRVRAGLWSSAIAASSVAETIGLYRYPIDFAAGAISWISSRRFALRPMIRLANPEGASLSRA